ncbi:MAG: sulfatase [bacterium]
MRKISSPPRRRDGGVRHSVAFALFIAAFAALAFGCARRDDPRPNVILISIDSLRGDRLGCYGYPRPVSPTLDRLAREGVLFSDVISQSSWTLPAHISLLTSQYGYRHGVNDEKDRHDPGLTTLAEAFGAGGYVTAAIVSGPLLRREFGLAEGFDHFDESAAEKRARESHTALAGPKTNRAILSFLDSTPSKPLFLFLHYWDVHYDYAPPAPYARLFGHDSLSSRSFSDFIRDKTINASLDEHDRAQLAALYDGEVRYTDHLIDAALSALRDRGYLEHAIVAVTSDHGDEFFEHGAKGHQNTLYDEVIRIPLILWFGDGAHAGHVIGERVELIDVYPTLLAAAGLAFDAESIDGRDLAPALGGAKHAAREPFGTGRPRISETLTKDRATTMSSRVPLEAIELDGRKLHVWRNQAARRELFDLRSDPAEAHDVYAAQRAGADALEALLTQRVASAGAASAADTASLDPATVEELRSLGYID